MADHHIRGISLVPFRAEHGAGRIDDRIEIRRARAFMEILQLPFEREIDLE